MTPNQTDTPYIHPIASEIAEQLRLQHVARVTRDTLPKQTPVQDVVDLAFRNYWLTQFDEGQRR